MATKLPLRIQALVFQVEAYNQTSVSVGRSCVPQRLHCLRESAFIFQPTRFNVITLIDCFTHFLPARLITPMPFSSSYQPYWARDFNKQMLLCFQFSSFRLDYISYHMICLSPAWCVPAPSASLSPYSPWPPYSAHRRESGITLLFLRLGMKNEWVYFPKFETIKLPCHAPSQNCGAKHKTETGACALVWFHTNSAGLFSARNETNKRTHRHAVSPKILLPGLQW